MKILKKGLALVLAVICCFAGTVTAFAATPNENETYATSESQVVPSTFGPGRQQFAGKYTFTNNNWTPVKTLQGLGSCSRFYINVYFKKADNYDGLVKLTVKVKRVSDGQIIDTGVFYPNSNGEGSFNTAGEEENYIIVNPTEEKIQVFVDASTYTGTPTGHYRSLWITYDFNLV